MTRETPSRAISAKTRLEFALALGITEQELETVLDSYHGDLVEWFRTRTAAGPKIDPKKSRSARFAAERLMDFLTAHGATSTAEIVVALTAAGFTENTVRDAIWCLIDRGKIHPDDNLLLTLPKH